jgi:hypothetical protein
MNKRDFLKNIAAVGGAFVLPTVPVKATPRPMMPREKEYLGYTYFFSGIIGAQDTTLKVGHWLGWPLRGFQQRDVPDRESFLYVSVPGFIGGPYLTGMMFNLTQRGGRHITFDIPSSVVESWIDEGEIYIRQLIEAYHGKSAATISNHAGFTFPQEHPIQVETLPLPTYEFGFTGFKPPTGRG